MSWLRTTGLRLLLAIGLGFSLWVFVSFTQNPDQTSSFDSVPVEVEGVGPGLLVVDQEGLPRANRATVDITVEGDEATIQTVRQSDLRAFVDLSDRSAGEYNNVPVSVVPNRTGLARLNFSTDPAFLSFRLDQEITRTVPLTIEVAGSVPFSFEKGQPSLTYQGQRIDRVQVRGPQNRVDRVASARATADIDRLTANYSSPRPVEAVSQDGQTVAGVTVEPLTIDVLVPIVSSAGVKRVPVVPNLVGAPASGFTVTGISVEPQFVRLTGSAGPLDSIQSIGTADLDLADASRTFTRTVALRPPANTGLDSGEPSTATVTVRVAPVTGVFQVTLPVPIQAANIPDGLQVALSPQVVQIALAGESSRLSAIDPSQLVGVVNLQGLAPGSYTLDPAFQLPEGVSIAGAPPRVGVTLRPAPTPTPTDTPTTPPNVTAEPAAAETASAAPPAGTPSPPAGTAEPTPAATATP